MPRTPPAAKIAQELAPDLLVTITLATGPLRLIANYVDSAAAPGEFSQNSSETETCDHGYDTTDSSDLFMRQRIHVTKAPRKPNQSKTKESMLPHRPPPIHQKNTKPAPKKQPKFIQTKDVFCIPTSVWQQIGNQMSKSAQTYPTAFGDQIRLITDFCHQYKAHECLIWTHVFSQIYLKDSLIPPTHYNVYLGLVTHSILQTSAILLPFFLDLVRDSTSFTDKLRSVLLVCSTSKLYPILEGMLLASILVVILAGVLVPSLQLGRDDVHADELLSPLVRVFPKVLKVCYTAAEGACDLVDDDIDYGTIWYFSVGMQAINLMQVILH